MSEPSIETTEGITFPTEITLDQLQTLKIKVKVGNKNEEDYVNPIIYQHRLKKKSKIFLVVFNGTDHYLAKCKIKNDFYLEYSDCYGKKKKIVICHDPSSLIIPNWKPAGADKYLVWYTDQRAECTHDPSLISYDIPVVENIVKYVGIVLESEIPRVIAEEIKGKKGFWDYFPYIIMLINNLFWFVFTNAQAEHYIKIINPGL